MNRIKSPHGFLAIVGLLVAALVVAGCGSSSGSSSSSSTSGGGESTSEGSAPQAKVALLLNAFTDFTQADKEGVETVVKKAGGSVTPFNGEFDPQEQLSQCQDAITSQRYNVIILAPADSPSSVPCATQAGQAGIPVIAMENPVGTSRTAVPPQLSEVAGSVVIDPFVDAKGTFKLVQKACKGITKCKWIAEIGTRSSSLDATKINYFEEQLEAEPNIELVQLLEGNYDPSETVKKIPDALAANPEVNVITFESDTNAVAAVPAVDSAGLQKQVKLIGDGASYAGVKAIEDGKIWATITSFPISMGELAGEMSLKALAGEKISPDGVDMFSLGSPLELDAQNAAQFKPQFGAKE